MSESATTGRILLDVAVILVAARAGGLLFERLHQPAVIGEIAAGIVLGPTLLGALPGDLSSALFPDDARSVLKLIGDLGLVLFMFTIGWDLDLALVRRRERAAVFISIASILLPFLLGLGLAAYLHSDHAVVDGEPVPFTPFALFIGAALSVTAFPVLARILQQVGLAGTPLGALVLSAAAVDDVIGWMLLAAALAVLTSAGAADYVLLLLETALFVAAVAAVLRPVLRELLRRDWPGAGVIVAAAALCGGYVTDAIGIHSVFGAFAVGLAMPRDLPGERAGSVRRSLWPAVALLLPVYFVTSGMGVDLPGLEPEDVVALGLILAAACVGKFAGAFAGARAARVEPRDAAAIAVLMNTRGLIEIVLLTVGRDRGLIDERLFTLFVVMAIVTTLLTAPLLRAIAYTSPFRRPVKAA
jgi:Kef-type K+ transport system membrane component KefB